jgi:putative transposase
LGDAAFVETILTQVQEQYTRQTAWTRRGVGVEQLVARVAAICQGNPQDVVAQGRQRARVHARSLLCFWAVRELGLSVTEMARRLGMSPPGVGYAPARRGYGSRASV